MVASGALTTGTSPQMNASALSTKLLSIYTLQKILEQGVGKMCPSRYYWTGIPHHASPLAPLAKTHGRGKSEVLRVVHPSSRTSLPTHAQQKLYRPNLLPLANWCIPSASQGYPTLVFTAHILDSTLQLQMDTFSGSGHACDRCKLEEVSLPGSCVLR